MLYQFLIQHYEFTADCVHEYCGRDCNALASIVEYISILGREFWWERVASTIKPTTHRLIGHKNRELKRFNSLFSYAGLLGFGQELSCNRFGYCVITALNNVMRYSHNDFYTRIVDVDTIHKLLDEPLALNNLTSLNACP